MYIHTYMHTYIIFFIFIFCMESKYEYCTLNFILKSPAPIRHHRLVRWRRARDRNSGARTNQRSSWLSCGINAQSRETVHRRCHLRPGHRQDIPQTYIGFVVHSCAWREAAPGGSDRVSAASRNRGKCPAGRAGETLALLAKILAALFHYYYFIAPESYCNV